MKKILTICPICDKKIHGKDIDIDKLQKANIKSWPVRYVHCHKHGIKTHALTLYLDAHFAVKGKEIAHFIKIENK